MLKKIVQEKFSLKCANKKNIRLCTQKLNEHKK